MARSSISQQNNELLNRINENVSGLAKTQLIMASEISDLKNSNFENKERVNRILGYLNSDSETNQEGLVEKVSRIENIVYDMPKDILIKVSTAFIFIVATFWSVFKFIINKE